MSKPNDLRLLLIGRSGEGKSSTCNAIIGREESLVGDESTSTTEICNLYQNPNRFGKNVQVVDTPGIFDTGLDTYATHKQLIRSSLLSTPGFHAIALVLKKGKFTPEVQETKDIFFEWFGQGVDKFSFVILTDTNSKTKVDEYLKKKPHPKLIELIKQCEGRVVPIQNIDDDGEVREKQVFDILKMAESIKTKNNNKHFDNIIYVLAKSYARRKHGRVNPDSLRLLTEAGINQSSLTPIQRKCAIYTIAEGGKNKKRTTSPNKYEEKFTSGHVGNISVTASPGNMGNLKIFDNVTMEPLHESRSLLETEMPVRSQTASNIDSETLQSVSRALDNNRQTIPAGSQTASNIDSETLHAVARALDNNRQTIPAGSQTASYIGRETLQSVSRALDNNRQTIPACSQTASYIDSETKESCFSDLDNNRKTRPTRRTGRNIDLNSFVATPGKVERETKQPLNPDHSTSSVSDDSDVQDSVELMKMRVNSDEDDQEVNRFIAFIRCLIPSWCSII